MIPIFIGYDSREDINFRVLEHSLRKFSTQPISICPIRLPDLSFYKETHSDGSTQFSYSRFLVPYLMNYTGWAIFMDCDIVAQDDVSQLWSYKDSRYAILCAKHSYKTSKKVKFLNNQNRNYDRKNWSSVMLINCGHPAVKILDPGFIENTTGEILHQFKWIDEELIGSIPLEWNWLVDEYGTNNEAKLIHYTLGSPMFNECKDTPMSSNWITELNDLQSTLNQRS